MGLRPGAHARGRSRCGRRGAGVPRQPPPARSHHREQRPLQQRGAQHGGALPARRRPPVRPDGDARPHRLGQAPARAGPGRAAGDQRQGAEHAGGDAVQLPALPQRPGHPAARRGPARQLRVRLPRRPGLHLPAGEAGRPAHRREGGPTRPQQPDDHDRPQPDRRPAHGPMAAGPRPEAGPGGLHRPA